MSDIDDLSRGMPRADRWMPKDRRGAAHVSSRRSWLRTARGAVGRGAFLLRAARPKKIGGGRAGGLGGATKLQMLPGGPLSGCALRSLLSRLTDGLGYWAAA